MKNPCCRLILSALFAFCLLTGYSSSLQAADAPLQSYEFKDVGLTLKLPALWQPIAASKIASMNQLIGRSGLEKVFYIGGLIRDPASVQPGQYSTNILIQVRPTDEVLTNEKIIDELSKLDQQTVDKELGTVKQETGLQANLKKPYLDPKLKIVVLPLDGQVGTNGVSFVGRGYIIPTKGNVVSINLYCRPEVATQIFAEVEQVLPQLVIAQNVKLPDTP
jgi:hypothetical protein